MWWQAAAAGIRPAASGQATQREDSPPTRFCACELLLVPPVGAVVRCSVGLGAVASVYFQAFPPLREGRACPLRMRQEHSIRPLRTGQGARRQPDAERGGADEQGSQREQGGAPLHWQMRALFRSSHTAPRRQRKSSALNMPCRAVVSATGRTTGTHHGALDHGVLGGVVRVVLGRDLQHARHGQLVAVNQVPDRVANLCCCHGDALDRQRHRLGDEHDGHVLARDELLERFLDLRHRNVCSV